MEAGSMLVVIGRFHLPEPCRARSLAQPSHAALV